MTAVLRQGDVLSSRFRIDVAVGVGGMGRVYRAQDLETGATVAVKVLLPGVPDGPAFFSREIRALSMASHPRIVRYVGHGTSGEGPFVAMEWLDGEDLRARLKRGPLSVTDTVAVGMRLAEALGHAHARGIVHRDVKPGNVFFVRGELDALRLVDFGLAMVGRSDLTPDSLVGTPGYMPPEQALGSVALDGSADVFALGCVLYKALTGRGPFAAEDAMASIAKVFFDDPPPPSSVRGEVPGALDAVVMRMLARDAKARPADGAAALRALRDVDLGEAPASSRPPPSLTHRELRIVSVLVAGRWAALAEEATLRGAPGDRSADLDEAARAVAARFGARVEVVGSAMIAALSGKGGAVDQAARAARLALALRAVLPELPVALATGRAEVGERVVGEVIDRAVARLHAARGGSISIDEVTSGLLGAAFEVGGAGGALELVSERPETAPPVRTLLGKPTPFVGREREMGALDGVLAACLRERSPRAAVVTAPAGVGKSRLRFEWLRGVARRPEGVQVFSCRADPMTAGSPFGLLSQIVRGAASIEPGDPIEAARARLRGRVARTVAAPEVQRVAEFLGEVVGVRFDDASRVELRAARQDPMLMGDQVRAAWETWMRAECDAAPTLVSIEDLHWADLPTMRLVEGSLRAPGGARMMVLMLARPEALESFGSVLALPSTERVDLGELDVAAAERLARHVLGARVPADVLARAVAKAAGNAFFLEEILRAIAEGKGDDVPETVLAMVERRLSTLEAPARRVLRAASVFGKTFWEGGVRELVGDLAADGAGDAATYLDALAEQELVTRSPASRLTGERELVFRHALVREAAYAMLTEDDRAMGHALAAEWLERRGERSAAELAGHFDRGRRPDRARVYYARAAAQALEGNDLAAVITLAEHACASGATGAELGDMRRLQAEAYRWRGRITDAEVAAREAVALLPRGSGPWCKAVAELVTAATGLGHVDVVSALAGEVLVTWRACGRLDPALAVAVARVASQLYPAGARELADTAVAELDRYGLPDGRHEPVAAARVQGSYAHRALYSSDVGTYYDRLQRARDLFEAAGDRRNACVQVVNLAYVAVTAGAFEEADAALLPALRTAEALGITRIRAIFLHNLGLLRVLQGRVNESIAFQQQAIEAFHAQGDRRLECFSRMYLAMAFRARGDGEGAIEEAERALEVAGPMRPAAASARAVLADALLAAGEAAEALEHAASAYATLEEIGGLEDTESLVRVVYAEALLAAGRDPEADAVLRLAVESLGARADRIRRAGWRGSFLSRVPENARTLALACARGLDPDALLGRAAGQG